MFERYTKKAEAEQVSSSGGETLLITEPSAAWIAFSQILFAHFHFKTALLHESEAKELFINHVTWFIGSILNLILSC